MSAYEHVYDRLETLIAYVFRYFGAIILLCVTVVGIPWGIRVAVRWFFGLQAIVLTDERAKQAISHSCRLVSGVWWRIFLTFLALIPITVLNVALSLAWPRELAAGLVSTALGLVTAPIFAAYWTAIYLQLEQQEAPVTTPSPEAPQPPAC